MYKPLYMAHTIIVPDNMNPQTCTGTATKDARILILPKKAPAYRRTRPGSYVIPFIKFDTISVNNPPMLPYLFFPLTLWLNAWQATELPYPQSELAVY